MSEQTDNLIYLLKPFGLTQEESLIYLNLLENNTSSALTISRKINMARTKVYRILDRLIKKQLVVQECSHSGYKFKASHPSQLELLLTQKETEISTLKQSLGQTISLLSNHININNPTSEILYYRGQEGLSQVNWNLLNAHGEYLTYEVDNADAYLPIAEAEKLRQALVEKKLLNRMLTNRKTFPKFTQVNEIVEKYWQPRFISPKILTIQADIFIYNDIFTICHYLENNDVFCLEMKNQFLVDMQKQIFENLWSQSKPVNIR